MSISHHYIEIDGVKLHFAESGDPDNDNILIFLHGFPEGWHAWQGQLAFFADKYRCIAPDLMGYNLSDKPSIKSRYQIENLMSLYAQFIQKVSKDVPVNLVAHDWGGAIAWPLSAFYSQLIKKLVIVNAAHPSTFTREMIHNPIQQKKSEYIHMLIGKDGPERLTENNFQYLQSCLFDNMKVELNKDKRQMYLDAWAEKGAIEGMLNYYRAMPQLAPVKDSHRSEGGPIVATDKMKIPNIRINQPTLVMWGEQDQAFVTEILDGLEVYVPNCIVKKFADASHWLIHEYPLEVNALIENFIEQ